MKLRSALASLAAAAALLLLLPASAASASTPHHRVVGTETFQFVTHNGGHTWTGTAAGPFVSSPGTMTHDVNIDYDAAFGACSFSVQMVPSGPGILGPYPGLAGEGSVILGFGSWPACPGLGGWGDYTVHRLPGPVTVIDMIVRVSE